MRRPSSLLAASWLAATTVCLPVALSADILTGYTATTTPSQQSMLVLDSPVDLEPGDRLVLQLEGEARSVFVHLVAAGADPRSVTDSLGIRAVSPGGAVDIRLYESHPEVTRIIVASGEQAYGIHDLGQGNGFATLSGAHREPAEAAPSVAPQPRRASVPASPIVGELASSTEWMSSWISFPAPRDFQAGDTLRLTVEGDATRVFVRAVPEGGDPALPEISLGSHDVATDGSVIVPLPGALTAIASISIHGGASPFGLKGFPEGNGAPVLTAVALSNPLESAGAPALEGTLGSSAQWGSGWIDLAEPVEIRAQDTLRLEIGGEAREVFVRLVPQGTPDSELGLALGVFPVHPDRTVTLQLDEDAGRIRQVFVQGGANAWGLYDMRAYNGPATLLGASLVPSR